MDKSKAIVDHKVLGKLAGVSSGKEDSKAEKEGWLTKQGNYIRNWRVRWFMLKDSKLYYYKEPSVEKKPTNFFPLNDCRVQTCEKLGPYCFELITGTGGKRYMQASSKEERDEWIAAIRKSAYSYSRSNEQPIEEPKEDPSKSLTPDHFNFIKVLGRGNYGKVMMASKKDDTSGTLYAVKIIKKASLTDQGSIDHILSENRVLQSMDNPFLVQMYFAFQTEDRLYFVMEYVRGGEMFYIMGKQGKFHEDRARLYAAEICSALTYLHNRGIVYRDLKLENLLLDEDGHIKITDFGLCKQGIFNPGDTTSTFCGTPEYLAPEILEEESYTRSVDWWALGIVLHEMLIGHPPFSGSDGMDQLFDRILHQPIKLPSFVSKNAANLLECLLERNVEKRIGSGPRDGDEIKEHPFFAQIDWTKLALKEITPTYIPRLASNTDTRNFDPEFTSLPPILTPAFEGKEVINIQGFTYVGDSKLDKN